MLIGWGLLLLFSLVMAISTFLPRSPQEMVSFAEGSGAMVIDFLFKIGVYDSETFRFSLVETWWFKALVILIGVFLLKAIVRLISGLGFLKTQKMSDVHCKYRYDGSDEEQKSFLIYNLEKSGFKVRCNAEGIVALKGTAFIISIAILHIGLFLTLVGGIFSYINYEKGSVYLPQGVRVSSQQIEGVEVREKLELEAEALWPHYYSIDEYDGSYNGYIMDYFANLKIFIDEKEKTVVASTSQNTKVGQYQFFLSDFGATGVLTIKASNGKELMDVFPVEYKQGFLQGSYVTKDNIGLSIAYSGVPNKNGKENFSYYIYEYTNKGWIKALEGQQEIFKPILYKNKEYIFKDVNRVAQFTVVKTNPILFYLGLITFFIGLTLFPFTKKFQLKFNLTVPQQVVIKGWSLPDKITLYEQMKKLSEQMSWEEM